jgi:hypothetical protein
MLSHFLRPIKRKEKGNAARRKRLWRRRQVIGTPEINTFLIYPKGVKISIYVFKLVY